jgi:UDP-N-acetylmuramate dehydrogenase
MTAIDPETLTRAEAVLRSVAGARVRARFPLAPLTSFRLGGPAALYMEANDDADLAAAAAAVAETGLPWTVIGKGSNLLVSDAGFAGLVIRLGKGYRWAARDGSAVRAGGAMPLPALSGVALSHGLAGLEFAVAIPATLGGAVRMNAGAHNGSMDRVVRWVDVFEPARRGRERLDAVDAGFVYRRSALPAGSIVVEAMLDLHPGDPAAIRREMEGARAWRRETQPLAEPNCGSVFKNPEGDHAARLVEAAGAKGRAVGGARVSEKHANFVVASPGATASDVWELIGQVQRLVEDQFGISLEREVQLVGEFDGSAV